MSDVMYAIRDHVREWRSHASQCIEANQLQLSHIIRANASHPPVLIEMFGEHFLANIYDFQFASRYTDADACSNIAQYRSSISFSLYHYSVIALQSPVGHRSICPQRPLPTIVLLFVRPHNDRQQPSYPEYADPSPKLHTTDNTKKRRFTKLGATPKKWSSNYLNVLSAGCLSFTCCPMFGVQKKEKKEIFAFRPFSVTFRCYNRKLQNLYCPNSDDESDEFRECAYQESISQHTK